MQSRSQQQQFSGQNVPVTTKSVPAQTSTQNAQWDWNAPTGGGSGGGSMFNDPLFQEFNRLQRGAVRCA